MGPEMSGTSREGGSILVATLVLFLALAVFVGTGAALMGTGPNAFVITSASTQALYAADGGIEMAIKEYTDSTDHDGDGTAGEISDDGNDGNDPSIGDASVSVDFTDPTFTSTARDGQARRVIEVTIE